MNRFAWALALAGLAAGSAATAAPIYRCGPDGRVYSQTPCVGGQVVDSSDPRSAAERAEARRVAAQERRAATEMQRQRLADEAATKPTGAAGMNAQPIPQATTAPATEHHRHGKRGARSDGTGKDFIAVEPGSGTKKPR